MTTALAYSLPADPCPQTQQLLDSLDPGFLATMSWDWSQRVLLFPLDHRTLGTPGCLVVGCGKSAFSLAGLCSGCSNRQRQSGQNLDEFVQTAKILWRCIGVVPCLVPQCQRPGRTTKNPLCSTHSYQQQEGYKLPMEEFLRHPQVIGLPRFGPCAVEACSRDRCGNGPYCQAHTTRLAGHVRSGAFDGDEAHWRLTTPAIAENRMVSLRALPDRVVAEVLYGLQMRTADGVKTRDYTLRPLCDRLREFQASAIQELDHGPLTKQQRSMARAFDRYVQRLWARPEAERHKDVWILAAFGLPGLLRFSAIQQPALREAVKVWAYDSLPRRRGVQAGKTVQCDINAFAELSESLRLQRGDRGLDLTGLRRQDILDFCNRLAFLVASGTMSAGKRNDVCRGVRRVLNRCRTLGLARPGQPLAGLSSDFALDLEDLPDEPEDSEAGRDLPDEVMRQLCESLDLLEEMSSREPRVAIELMIDTGRRPDEICRLKYDCLSQDPDGTWVLVYDNFKAHRFGRRLPIGQATAALILGQQERIRHRFPHAAVGDLKLFATPVANPEGRKSISAVNDQHRNWVVDALPEILVPHTLEVDGERVVKMMPFDKTKIFPYAYRHTFAQRYADAGVEPDVLRALMDHRLLSTTQCYYQVRDERRREAVDRVTAMQFDRHGTRVWRGAQEVLDSEHIRRAVGEVQVPYGVCVEPSNVAAGGKACPVRFRCVGCGHFRTDVSYLPDLEAYLADLRRNRERLIGTFDADDWAKAEAMPSSEEIRRVKRLIDRVRGDLEGLAEEEKAQVLEAVSIVRRGRQTLLGMPRVGPPEPDFRVAGPQQ